MPQMSERNLAQYVRSSRAPITIVVMTLLLLLLLSPFLILLYVPWSSAVSHNMHQVNLIVYVCLSLASARIEAFRNKCYMRMLGVSCRDNTEQIRYGNRPINVLARLGSSYCQPSSVASYHGSAMSGTYIHSWTIRIIVCTCKWRYVCRPGEYSALCY